MRVISKDEAFRLYPMKDAVEATEAAFVAYSRGGCETPLRTCLQVGDHGSTLFMPASTGESVGVKIVSVRGEIEHAACRRFLLFIAMWTHRQGLFLACSTELR